MSRRPFLQVSALCVSAGACSGDPGIGTGPLDTPGLGSAGTAAAGNASSMGTGGTPSPGSAGLSGIGGMPVGVAPGAGTTAEVPSTSAGAAGASSDAGGAGPGMNLGGAGGAVGGGANAAGEGGMAAGGTSPIGTPGGMTTVELEPLDCGPDGWAVENHGPPENRVNYIILGDGYDSATIDTTLEEHVNTVLERRFNHESGEPYGRYRNFVNICVMKVVSESNGIGNGPTAFDGGNGGDRLASVDERKVGDYLDANLPMRLEADWTAVVLNQDLWENTGARIMLWSGAHGEAPGAALHEGGHGFHQLADEYGSCTGAGCGEDTNGSGPTGQEYDEVNSSGDPGTTGGKWDLWLGSTQVAMQDPSGEATGLQSTFSGSRYVSPEQGQYRPSDNSMMNSLFGDDPNTSFNSVSREQMVFSIWQHVRPVDSALPAEGAVSGAGILQVNVVDPAVINVDWSVDGAVVAENGGTTFDTATLGAGAHAVSARAYDNATEDLVRLRSGECPSSVGGFYCHGTSWPNSEQTVEWTVTIP